MLVAGLMVLRFNSPNVGCCVGIYRHSLRSCFILFIAYSCQLRLCFFLSTLNHKVLLGDFVPLYKEWWEVAKAFLAYKTLNDGTAVI